jgi:hypothetical protein
MTRAQAIIVACEAVKMIARGILNGEQQARKNGLLSTPENGIMLEDGGEGSGRYPKGSGETLSAAERKASDAILHGTVTKDGVTVKSTSEHAYERMAQRKIDASKIRGALTEPDKTEPGHTDRTTAYRKGKLKIIFDHVDGKIVSVMEKGGK